MVNEYYQQYNEEVEVIAINVDEPDLSVTRFVEQNNLSFPVVIDKGMKVVDAYGVRPLPTIVLIDEDGQIENVHVGGMRDSKLKEFMAGD